MHYDIKQPEVHPQTIKQFAKHIADAFPLHQTRVSTSARMDGRYVLVVEVDTVAMSEIIPTNIAFNTWASTFMPKVIRKIEQYIAERQQERMISYGAADAKLPVKAVFDIIRVCDKALKEHSSEVGARQRALMTVIQILRAHGLYEGQGK